MSSIEHNIIKNLLLTMATEHGAIGACPAFMNVRCFFLEDSSLSGEGST